MATEKCAYLPCALCIHQQRSQSNCSRSTFFGRTTKPADGKLDYQLACTTDHIHICSIPHGPNPFQVTNAYYRMFCSIIPIALPLRWSHARHHSPQISNMFGCRAQMFSAIEASRYSTGRCAGCILQNQCSLGRVVFEAVGI